MACHPALPKQFAQFFSSAGNGLNVIILADNPFYSQLEHVHRLCARSHLHSPFLQIKPGSGISPADLSKFKESSATLETMKKTGVLGYYATFSHLSLVSLRPGVKCRPHHQPGRCSAAALWSAREGPHLLPSPRPILSLVISSFPLADGILTDTFSLAQNSIGSGFDVSAAVYGSQLYGRFSPALLRLPTVPLDVFVQLEASCGSLIAHVFCPQYEKARAGLADVSDLFAVLQQPWDDTHVPAALPGGLSLLLGTLCYP